MEASEPVIDSDCGDGGWIEAVEDLVDAGDVRGAISILESVVARLEGPDGYRQPPDDLRLASALRDLAGLQDSRGYSLKADELRSRALALRARAEDAAAAPTPALAPEPRDLEPVEEEKIVQKEVVGVSSTSNDAGEEEDDWEAIADRGLQDDALLLSPQDEAKAKLKPSHEEPDVVVTPNRRGRGSFLYKKSCLYSEQLDSLSADDNQQITKSEVVEARKSEEVNVISRKPRIGTSHVLVVYELSPSTRTADLERIFEKYKDGGVAIRWVNDTVALAVFRTPALALEAQSSTQHPFKIRSLNDDDDLLSQIARKVLEPPCPRPKTSTRTAQRLIAQGMGYKPSSEFGSKELKKQEEERKNRILARQTLRDDAWGS